MASSEYRLDGSIRGREARHDIPAEGGVVGSDPACELHFDDPTISRQHAELEPTGDGLLVRDLGSTNGTWLRGARVDEVVVQPGDTVVFGRVRMMVESVAPSDREVALRLSGAYAALEDASDLDLDSAVVAGGERTLSFGRLDAMTTDGIPRVLELLAEGAPMTTVAQAAGAAMIETLPLTRVEIERDGGSTLFQGAGTEVASEEVLIESTSGAVTVRVGFGNEGVARSLRKLVVSLGAIVGAASQLVHRGPVGQPDAPKDAESPKPPSVESRVREIYRLAGRVAPGQIGVLILGESGTGKEVLARAIHRASGREPFVALNCAALPRDLLEAELFGVEKGTATGVEARPGKMELADKGTLFLDEIGDMSLETQSKILRVLQEGEVYRLGSSKPRSARARVLAATNKSVAEMVEDGSFRLDLYHRIAGWVVELPALRDRPGDIPNLAVHFLSREGRKLGRRYQGISQAALDTLLAYHWPGNIRQLQQEIARCALFLEDGEILETSLLGPTLSTGSSTPEDDAGTDLASRVERFERAEIRRALAASDGKVAPAADRLGMHRATLYRRMKALGLDGEE